MFEILVENLAVKDFGWKGNVPLQQMVFTFNINLYSSLFPISFHHWKIWVWVSTDIGRLMTSICSSASLAMRNIGEVRKYLDQMNTERLVHAFILFRLNYCNRLLYGLPEGDKMKHRNYRPPQLGKSQEHKDQRTYLIHWLLSYSLYIGYQIGAEDNF